MTKDISGIIASLHKAFPDFTKIREILDNSLEYGMIAEYRIDGSDIYIKPIAPMESIKFETVVTTLGNPMNDESQKYTTNEIMETILAREIRDEIDAECIKVTNDPNYKPNLSPATFETPELKAVLIKELDEITNRPIPDSIPEDFFSKK